MGGIPDGKCGYIWPEDYEVGDYPRNQSCCWRDVLPDTDRCAWHADPDDTSAKTIDTLRDARVDSEVRNQISPLGELLDGAILRGLELEDTLALNRAALRDADLSDADLGDANLSDTNLREADLSDTALREASLQHADLRDADLSDADIGDGDLSDADLREAVLQHTNLGDGDLSGADLRETDLSYAALREAALQHADLREADLSDTALREAALQHADLRKADLSDTTLREATLQHADLRKADLSDTTLREATLQHADLRYTDLRNADLQRSDLSDADLRHADLSNIDMRGATVKNTDFREVEMADDTVSGGTSVDTLYDEEDDTSTAPSGVSQVRATSTSPQEPPAAAPEDVPGAPELDLAYSDLDMTASIGRGGSAVVCRVTVTTDDGTRTLAVKQPRLPEDNKTLEDLDLLDQLLDEAETWQRLDDHDHIVDVVDYGEKPLAWIAMEHMDGGHLGEYIDEMSLRQKLWTALAITRGTYHAHENGVIHRDLRPQNILFRSVEEGWDVPKIADWGLSKRLLDHSKSSDGKTVTYAAPEQFRESSTTDKSTDIYQLGAVLYELFTGQPPFQGETFVVMKKIEHEQPTPPSEIADVPDRLDEILLRALAKDPADRYEHVLLLRNDLQELFREFE